MDRDIQKQDLELIQLIEVSRHGARSPYYDIWDYRYNWNMPLKVLTQVGQRQHYLIGQEIYKRYGTAIFNNGKFDQSQISVFSTSSDRAQQSALCQLYGIYQQKGESTKQNWTFNPQTDLPPMKIKDGQQIIEEMNNKNLPNSYVPINVKIPNDQLLLEASEYSLGYRILKQNNFNTELFKQLDEQEMCFKQEFLQKFNLQNEMEVKDLTLKTIADYWDLVICDIYQQIPLPECFTKEFLQRFEFIYDFMQVYIDFNSSCGELLKLQTTTFFNELIYQIRNNNDIKFSFFCGSDYNVNSILVATGHTGFTIDFQEWLKPTKYQSYSNAPFAATIFFEIYQSKSTQRKYIKMIYNEEPVQITGCSSILCDFENEFVPIITKQAILPEKVFKQVIQQGFLIDN